MFGYGSCKLFVGKRLFTFQECLTRKINDYALWKSKQKIMDDHHGDFCDRIFSFVDGFGLGENSYLNKKYTLTN